jgi:hypothetical protein
MTIEVWRLSDSWFDRFPVWAWAEDDIREDLVRPVEVFGDALPLDEAPLFIRATFRTPSGLQFRGYIVWETEVFAVQLNVEDQEIGFNSRLKDLAEGEFRKVEQLLGSDATKQFFPLTFNTEFRTPYGEKLLGEFKF